MAVHLRMGPETDTMAPCVAHLSVFRCRSFKFHFINCNSSLVIGFHYLAVTSIWKRVSDVSVL
jgi:hypothetical protein